MPPSTESKILTWVALIGSSFVLLISHSSVSGLPAFTGEVSEVTIAKGLLFATVVTWVESKYTPCAAEASLTDKPKVICLGTSASVSKSMEVPAFAVKTALSLVRLFVITRA